MSGGEKFLVEKTLTKVEVTTDKKAIRFTVDGEIVVAKCEGDCCSVTWIEHVSMPAGGLPAKILAVEELCLGSQSPDEYDVIQFYGMKITTDKGELVLDYRNSSNGYYGGNLSWPGEYYYEGVYNQNVCNEEWADV